MALGQPLHRRCADLTPRKNQPVCPNEPVGLKIQARIEAVAAALRVTEQTAHRDFDDETIQNLARGIASQLAASSHAPIFSPSRRPTSSRPLAGRTNVGLTFGAQLALTAAMTPNTGEQIHQIVNLVSFRGGILIERSAARPGGVAVPEALIHRTVREFGKAIAPLDAGVRPQDGGEPCQCKGSGHP
ncbi:hypothetical protein ATK86_4071 [Nocardia fluminea]|uniref:Uncharacterized protein n=1 Tax=Nocardia fluminea TaxID=134984 RepID=A0A2N3VDJ9_9NOCA|nr:hypothetical protein ATK86_4071 [Nocardia fluminea]